MLLSIALVCLPANSTIARWQFTYPYSGNLENDRVFTSGPYVYYEQTEHGLTLRSRMRIDNLRDVAINETTSEIHVQLWGLFNTSVIVLHFTKAQRELAHEIAARIERLEFCGYLPMQKRAKMPVSSSSFAASPVS